MDQPNFMLDHHQPNLEDEQFDDDQLPYDDDDSDEPDFDPDSEDEGIEDYKIGGYHPVHIGEVIFNRYVIIQKLGWGHFSTVWLAKDMKFQNYVAIKIQKSAPNYLQASYDEVEILQKVERTMKTDSWLENLKKCYPEKTNFGRDDTPVVGLLNCFIHKGPYGNHFCFIFEILGVNLYEIIKRYNFKGVPIDICQKIAKEVLVGLDFLHRFCGVIHTDLKPENILVCLSEDEKREIIENGFLKHSEAYRERIKEYQKAHGIKVEDPVEKQKEKQIEECKEKLKVMREKEKKLQEQYKEKCPTLNKTQRKNAKKHINKFKSKIQETEKELKAIFPPQPEKQKISGALSMLQLDPPKKLKNLRGPKLTNSVRVKIADLGNACWTHHHFAKTIQTRQYRSPQTLLGVQYNTNADMWSFGCMLYELLTGHLLFEPTKDIGITKNEHHLALMQERMGMFSETFKKSSIKYKHYFKGGKLKNFQKIPKMSIKSLLCGKFEIDEREAAEFESFLEPMLRHDPSERISAFEALKSPWLSRQIKSYKMDPEEILEYVQNIDGSARRDDGCIVKLQENRQHDTQLFDADCGQPCIGEPLFPDHRNPINLNLIDRSFTDLGYIGYCDGICLDELDEQPNWQFQPS